MTRTLRNPGARAVQAWVGCVSGVVLVVVVAGVLGARSAVPRSSSGAALNPHPVRFAAAPASAPPQPAAVSRAQSGAQSARFSLSIPSIGVHDLSVIAYVGFPDDRAGTLLEDRGMAASPLGPRGGVGPGQVGNMIVTGHRTSAGGPLRRLPALKDGAHVLVTAGGRVYDYVITAALTISFRSAASMALQSAPVPGHPGAPATQPMITLSTCATLEDHASGNYWADALGNPEHRIDKVGVLVAVRPLG